MKQGLESFWLRVLGVWVIAVLVTGVVTHPLIAATFFVDPGSGDDGRSAVEAQDEASPWKTLTRAASEPTLATGDVIRLASGTYGAASGETFPIAVPDGVAILGIGPSDTVVDADTADAFLVEGDRTDGIWIGDMSIHSSGVGVSFGLDDATINATLDNLEFAGADKSRGIYARQLDGAGEFNLTLSNSTFTDLWAGAWLDAWSIDTGRMDITVDNTTFTNSDYGLLIDMSVGSNWITEVDVQDSTFDNVGDAIWYWVYSAYGAVQSRFTLGNTTFTGVPGSSLSVTVSSVYSADSLDWQVDVLDSNFQQASGIDLDAWYLYDVPVTLDYTISGNTFSGINGTALSFSVSSFSSLSIDTRVVMENNTIDSTSDDALYYYEGYGYYGDQNTDITIHNNTFTNIGNDAMSISFYECYYFDNRSVDLKVMDNRIHGVFDDALIYWAEYLEEGGDSRQNLTVAGNTVTDIGDQAVALYASDFSSNSYTEFEWTVLNNTITDAQGDGVAVELSYLDYGDGGKANITVAGNTISSVDGTGIYLSISSWYDTPASQRIMIAGNTVTESDSGIYIDLTDQSNLVENLTRIEDNLITGSGDYGIYVDTDDYPGGPHVALSGNASTGHSLCGLYLSGSTAGLASVPFDLGGGALQSRGHNTFVDNGECAVYVAASDTAEEAIPAQYNYFGTTDPGEISAMVYDHADNGAVEALDTSNPLPDMPQGEGAEVNLELEIVDDQGATGVTPGDTLKLTAALQALGDIGCRAAWLVAPVPDGVSVVPGTATTSFGLVFDYDENGLNVAVGHVPVDSPVTVSWQVTVAPDDACGDLEFQATLRCSADTGDVEVVDRLVQSRLQSTTFLDRDGDGYGDDATEMWVCGEAEAGRAEVGGDCNDLIAFINPGAEETCNTMDDDCDGDVDEGVTGTFYVDADADGYGDPDLQLQACVEGDGISANGEDCDDADPAVNPSAEEVCDEVDNDCDGTVDEDLTSTFYLDADGDGQGDPDTPIQACGPRSGLSSAPTDCDDGRADVWEGAEEVCDEVDNDCDGDIDEDVQAIFYADLDSDGYGDETATLAACAAPQGYVDVSGDCVDSDPTIHPDAAETCDEVDNDCDGAVDEEAGTTFYPDNDGDGYGTTDNAVVACTAPEGHVVETGDCDDADAGVYPGAEEVCDEMDNDCDGTVDEEAGSPFFADTDNDGFGDPTAQVIACNAAEGHVADNTDCDDQDPATYPGADEICDEVDNNCDGTVDEGVASLFYADQDRDGYGTEDDTVSGCEAPRGYADRPDDCDDADSGVYPGAEEVCDEMDNDCDGVVDEDAASTFYADSDGDGYGTDADTTTGCQPPDGYVAQSDDCNDEDPEIHPAAEEVCDGVDNDCNGEVDEIDGCAESSPTVPPGAEIEGGGCSCHTGAAASIPSVGAPAWLGLALAGTLFRRRRTRSRQASGVRRNVAGSTGG